MDTDSDPLAISPADNLSLFGGSIENIEFVVESDEDGDDVETKRDNVVIEIDDLEEQDIEEILNCKQVLNIPYPTLSEDQIIDLDALTTNSEEVKAEIEVEDTDVKSTHCKENEPIICEELENVDQNDIQKGSCYVPDCKNKYDYNHKNAEDIVHWFNVPTEANLKKIWDICIGRVDKHLTEGELVCHKHFSEDDIVHNITVSSNDRQIIVPYNKPKLRRGAIPCITYHKECVVPTCGRDNGKMYCFPVLRMSDFHLWIYMIKNPILKNLEMKEILRYRVCNIHFDTDCFDDDFLLKRTAAPTLYLPENYILDMAAVKPVTQSDVLLICAHGECPKRSNTGKNVFRFPTVPEKCIAWLEACGRQNLISSPYATVRRMSQLRLGVCDDHFSSQDFDGSRSKLKLEAIPKSYSELDVDFRKSKSFPAEETESSSGSSKVSNISTKTFENLKENIICCAVENCPNIYGAKFCKKKNLMFPNPNDDLQRYNIWLQLIASPQLHYLSQEELCKRYMVCVRHFETQFYRNDGKASRLSQEAVPTKNLTADHQWFFTSEYYKTRLQNYFDNLAIQDIPENVIIEWKKEDNPNKNESEDKTRCVLEKDRIRFPGMGHYYYMGQSVNVTKRKIPYSVYNYFNTGYGLNNDVEVGENIRIHTAIIIDDDDDCEREVLQQLLDKRKKAS